MTGNGTNRSRVAPAILIVIAAFGLLLGLGRCGFLQPAMRPAEDYGISGAFFLVVGFALLLGGLIWLSRRRRKDL